MPQRVYSPSYHNMVDHFAKREELKRKGPISHAESRRLLKAAHVERKKMDPVEQREWLRVAKQRAEVRNRGSAERKRAFVILSKYLAPLKAARNYRSYAAVRKELLQELSREFTGTAVWRIRRWMNTPDLVPQYGFPKQFHTGHFPSEGDAANFIKKNKRLAMHALIHSANIQSHPGREQILSEIMPRLVEYMMRFSPERGKINPYFYAMVGHAARDYLKSRRALKNSALSMDEWEGPVARPVVSIDPSTSIELPSSLTRRDRIILLAKLEGHSPRDIAKILAKETRTTALSERYIRRLVSLIEKKFATHKK